MLVKGNSIGTHNVALFWASLKTGNKWLHTCWLDTSHCLVPSLQGKLLEVVWGEACSPMPRASLSCNLCWPLTWARDIWKGILGTYCWVTPCSWNDLTPLCLLCHQQPQNNHVFAEGWDHSHDKFAPPQRTIYTCSARKLVQPTWNKREEKLLSTGKWAEPFLLTEKAPSLNPATSANKGW